MHTFRGKVRKLPGSGKRAQVARSSALCEIYNSIPGLKIGDLVLCNDLQTIRKLDPKQNSLWKWR